MNFCEDAKASAMLYILAMNAPLFPGLQKRKRGVLENNNLRILVVVVVVRIQ